MRFRDLQTEPYGIEDRCRAWPQWQPSIITAMNDQQKAEFYLLKLRSAVTDKAFAVACAEMENARGGWTCDWNKPMSEAQRDIEAAEAALRSI